MWDMSQERAFIENLLGQRVNFFLLLFSLVIAGAISSKNQQHLIIVLVLGAIICWLLALTIFRSQQKLDLILDELMKNEEHPVAIIDKKAKGISMRRIIGYIVPISCSISLTIGALLSWANILNAS